MKDAVDEIHLVPPKRQSFAVGSTTGLNQQHDRHPKVRWCRFKDPMFFLNSEHFLGWPLVTLIEMLYAGARILPDVLSLERELEDAMQARQFPVDRGPFHRPFWIPLQRLAAPIVAILYDATLIHVRKFTVPKIALEILYKLLED